MVDVQERFPITLGLAGFWIIFMLTAPFISLSVDTTPVLSAKAEILIGMFVLGIILLIGTSVIFSKKGESQLELVRPDKPFQGFTLGQALVVITGFLVLAIWQLYLNQAFFSSALAPYTSGSTIITPGPTTSFLFKIDSAIAEEALFGGLTILAWLTLSYVVNTGKLAAGVLSALMVAGVFAWFHFYVYGTNPAALIFVFGARVVLSGTLLATIYYSRKISNATHRRIIATAALVAPNLQHTGWNVLS